MNIKALQHPDELAEFVQLVRFQSPTSYLEIGAKFGGTFAAVSSVLQRGARMVAVDLPGGTKAWGESKPSLEGVVADLRAREFDASIIWGDSTSLSVVEIVRKLGPYDVVLIDANHTLPYLEKDWANYGPMGKMIAFHDISWERSSDFSIYSRIDVPQLWNKLKVRYPSLEIKLDPTKQDNGFGIIWR